MASFGGGNIIFTFRHLVFIILQLIDNYSVVEIIEKNTFYLLVCKESSELEAEIVFLKFTTWIRFS